MKTLTSILSGAALILSAIFAPAANLLTPDVPVLGVAATPGSAVSAVATIGTAAGVNNYPAAESPNLAIDGATGTKYLNFAKVNTGLILTIPGGLTTVTGVQFNAANDAPDRDPITITIEGTTAADPATAAANATWTLLYSGASGLGTDPGRFAAGASLAFFNSAAFDTYRVLVTGVRNAGAANSVQFSELQLFGGTADTTAPTVFSTVPTQGSVVRELRHVEVIFSEPVDGVDAADLLINGVPATNINFGTPNQFIFDFPQPPTGTVTIAFAPNHGIWDQAANPNPFAGASWTYTLDPNTAFFDVRINEIMANNQNGIRDEDGSREDWIELYNAGSTAVNLEGWFLTDDEANPSKWRFPAGVQMSPNSYLLIWASGKDRANIGALHTSFKLGNAGDFLALVLPDSNTLVSAFTPAYPPQRADVSYGRDRLDPNLVGFYATPTPGAANSTSGGSGFASDVTFERSSGTFVNPFSLVLSTPSANAVIRYVLITNFAQATATITNVPTTNSPIYTGPIPISVTTQVRARAFEPGLLPGTPLTESYVQISPNVLNFSSDVPVVVMHMLGKGSISANTTTESGILMAFDTNSFRSSLTNAPQVATRMGIHTRGSSTGGQAKSSLRVEFWDEFNQDVQHPFLGLPSESDWVFYGINGFDPGLMHNAVFYWLGRTLGIASQRTRFVEVFRKIDNGPVTTNDYFGLYLLVETPKVGKDRVDIASLHDQDTNAPAITGGYIAKIDRVDNEQSFSPPQIGSIRTTPSAIAFTDPPFKNNETDPRRLKQINYFKDYIYNFITNLDSASYTNPVTGYAKYIDPDQWVNNLFANVISFNVDGYRLSGFIYKDREDRLKQGPLWDCDRCLGTGGTATPQGDNRCFSPRYWRLPANDVGTDNGTDFFGVSNVGVSWFKRLFSDPDFWQRFIDRYQNYRTREFSSNSIVAMVDGFYKEIKEAQVREQDRWAPSGFNYPRAGVQTVSGYTFDFGPGDNKGRGRFTNEVNFQKTWLLDRLNFIDTNFLNMPTLSSGTALVPSGTMVTAVAAAKAGTLLLYTLDGTDPRLPGGAVSPSARTNVGTLTLTVTNNIRLFARSYNTSHANMTNSGTEVGKPLINSYWSGPAAATYYTVTPSLSITELMFHPANPPAGDTNDADSFEFIELKNTGATALNLAGFTLSGGIDFTFTNFVLGSGQYCVVVKNSAAFQSRYGTGPTIAGVYAGNLANDGDHVVLRGPLQEPILDFVYQDNWFPLTDSLGFSLVVQNESAPSDLSTNTSWRVSSVDGGSPGVSNPPPSIVSGVVLVNEALTHTDPPPPTDTIELYNPGPLALNIGGWWLTDDFSNPKKYQIPGGTTIPAGGYLLFDESQFNPTPGTNNSFALGSSGDQVYVFSGTNGFITGYYHGFDFGAAQNGRTFGRYVNSQGAEHFVAQAANTLGATNSLPLVGPIVISEIMYHPPETGSGGNLVDNVVDEFIELYNLSSTNVPLYHSLYPANTWKLSSAVDFSFPLNQSLAPNSFAVVVSFDPGNSAALSTFRAKYGMSASVPVYGPYAGKLDNSANSVRLTRPDSPNGLSVPQILVDRIDYADAAPWPPVADGIGASLQRLVLQRYGNDVTNWTAARPTPGSLAEGGAVPQIVQQPHNVTVVEGMTTNLSVQVSSPTPVTYQWRLNSNSVPNATSATLVFSPATLAQAGNYSVAVFNGGGSIISTSVVVSVLPLPVISQQPISQNVLPGTNFTLSVIATGTGPLSYQWRFNGANILGATSSSLSYVNAQLDAHSGLYDVLITDSIGTRLSQAATVIVLVRPVISVQPVPVTVLQGQTARFSVTAGPIHPLLPLTYRWLRNGSLWASNTFPDLVITNCQSNGTFRVTVGNLAGTVNSVPAGGVALTVLSDFDHDGMADIWETQYGFNTNNAADASLDFDGDGMINRDEYVAGTNPLDPLSLLKIILSATNTTTLQFVAQTNIGYTVQYRTNLSSAFWNSLTNILSSPQVRTMQVDVASPPGLGERYYRVVTPLVP